MKKRVECVSCNKVLRTNIYLCSACDRILCKKCAFDKTIRDVGEEGECSKETCKRYTYEEWVNKLLIDEL